MTSEDESKKEEIEIWTPEDVFKTYDKCSRILGKTS